MASRSSKRLVIDASVARASGGDDAIFPASKHCRDVLLATLCVCHRHEAVRSLLAAASHLVGELRPLLWANPAVEVEDVVTWLEKGAWMEKARQLGQFPGSSPV